MRPSRDHVLIQHALLAAERGTCSRAKVGAIVALEGRILVTGYNGAPAGMPHCDHPCTCQFQVDGVPVGHLKGCAAGEPCEIAVHAEANAIAFAARHGVALLGATIYTTTSPCHTCAKLIINAGLERLVYHVRYRRSDGLDLLENAGIALEHFQMI